MSLLRRILAGIGGRPPEAPHRTIDLTWVDEFIDNVRPYVFVREEDNLLIKRPNQAHKLNPQGVELLGALLAGRWIGQVLDRIGREPRRVRDVALFLLEIKRCLEGRLNELRLSRAVEVQPFDLGFSKLPILSEVAITYRCNLRCSFCYAGCNCTTSPIGGDATEMTVGQVQEVLRKIYHQAKVPSVSFSGGEPTLRRELPRLVSYAKQLGMRVNLITNGTRVTADLARELSDAGLDSAQVSLEGVTAETHEKVTAIHDSYSRTLDAVSHLRSSGVLVHTNTTILRDNLHECLQMPRFVKESLGNQRFSMNLLVPTGSAAVNGGLAVRYTEVGAHLEAIAAESERAGVEFMWYSPVPMCMFNTVAHGLGNKGCSACDGLISVAANGDVLPCASFDESVGNLLRQDADAIWRSHRARQHRDKFLAHPQCRSCEQFHICNGACPLYWRQMGFGELQQAQGFAPPREHGALHRMILPAAEDRSIVVFHVWPSLTYRARMIVSFALIAAGLALQFAMTHVLPGILLIAAGNLLLLVRGYDNRVDFASFDPLAEWEAVDRKRLEDLRRLHLNMRQWDVSAIDISNALGAVLFVVVALALGVLAFFSVGPARILVIDAMVLLLPHWFTGIRSVLVQSKLMVKVDMTEELLQRFQRDLSGDQVQLLMLLAGGETKMPEDVKFKVDLADHHPDLLGFYGQVVLNEVQGRSYPYFYVVVVARRGFGLEQAYLDYAPPEGITTEFDEQEQVEVLVLRQTTTKTSGYHTDASKAARILDAGLGLARRVGAQKPTEA